MHRRSEYSHLRGQYSVSDQKMWIIVSWSYPLEHHSEDRSQLQPGHWIRYVFQEHLMWYFLSYYRSGIQIKFVHSFHGSFLHDMYNHLQNHKIHMVFLHSQYVCGSCHCPHLRKEHHLLEVHSEYLIFRYRYYLWNPSFQYEKRQHLWQHQRLDE